MEEHFSIKMRELGFPQINESNSRQTSPKTWDYNCIAWAAGDDSQGWWPLLWHMGPGHWPDGVPRVVTIAAFIAAYQTIGYEVTSSPIWIQGVDRIAIYSKNGAPTHAARQLTGDEWTSKLGSAIDIAHTLEAIEGDAYGYVEVFMERPHSRRPRRA